LLTRRSVFLNREDTALSLANSILSTSHAFVFTLTSLKTPLLLIRHKSDQYIRMSPLARDLARTLIGLLRRSRPLIGSQESRLARSRSSVSLHDDRFPVDCFGGLGVLLFFVSSRHYFFVSRTSQILQIVYGTHETLTRFISQEVSVASPPDRSTFFSGQKELCRRTIRGSRAGPSCSSSVFFRLVQLCTRVSSLGVQVLFSITPSPSETAPGVAQYS